MASLAVDPALLYAKLEVAKIEQDTAHRASRDHKTQTKKEEQVLGGSVAESKSRQRESLRKSLLLDSEWTADGKPCFNTAHLLAMLETKPLKHGSPLRTGASKEASPRVSMDDVVPAIIAGQSKARRRFKVDENASKLVVTKHGSQTTYERVDVPADAELLENQDKSTSRPRLMSKYDRPHWAQQSQNSNETRRMKLPSVRYRRHQADEPSVETAASDLRPSVGLRQSSQGSDTLIADAVKEIKKEQRLRKLHSVSTLFRRA